MNKKNTEITGADYKLYLNNITQTYISDLKRLKIKLEEIINADIENSCFYKQTLNETNDILNLFDMAYKRYKAILGIKNIISPTPREFEIMCAIYDGLTIKEIQDKLHISNPTLKTHLQHILDKIQQDVLLNYGLKKDNAEIIENKQNYDIYKLNNPYETIKKFVNMEFYPNF